MLLFADFLKKKQRFLTEYQSVKRFGPRLGPDLDPNCLQRLSAVEQGNELKLNSSWLAAKTSWNIVILHVVSFL